MTSIIDISRWNGPISWGVVRDAGVECAIIRASLGSTGKDDRYETNWRESGEARIPRRGGYHYFITQISGQAQFDNIMRVTKGDFGNVPFTIDCERTKTERQKMADGWAFPKANYTEQLRVLCNLLKQRTPIRIYSNKWEWEAITTQPIWAVEFGFHVAAYPDDPSDPTYKPLIPKPWTDWTLWQYSSTGSVQGINGNVDLNRERTTQSPGEPLVWLAEINQLTDKIRKEL